MSVSSEVQRTLVKSPPELWAELSDPATLARHLGELGEIQIVRTEPDRAVDWEAAATDGAQSSGRVEIEPSGWGTRVTLSAQRMVVTPEAEPKPESAVEAEPEPVAAIEVVPVTSEVEPEPEATESESESESEDIVEVEPEIVEPTPRPRFFARFFRRRRQPEPEAEPAVQSTSEPAYDPDPEPVAAVEVEEPVVEETPSERPAPEERVSEEPSLESSPDTPEPDISTELVELEEQTTAVLTGVLDRLGAAHHRPFSRA